MKKRCLIYFGILLLPVTVNAQIIQTTDWTPVMGGEYNVANNVWGTGVGVGSQSLTVDLSTTYWKVILSTHNSSSVASYPFIWKGSHWGNATTINNPMPKMLREIGTAPFTWTIDTTGVTGTWDAAFECWIDDVPASTSYDGELMIWINYGGGAGPAGNRVAAVNIGGLTWDVYFYLMGSPPSTWNYIAYKITSPVDSISVDLKDFLHDALTRGYLKTSWYLANMEAGFEIWRNGQGLTTKSYSADVTTGSSLDVNYAPVPFNLIAPSNKKSLTSMVIPFTWESAIDPNGDQVEYLFHLTGPNIDTVIGPLYNDSLLFDGTNHLQSYTLYTWYVEATDGIDTTQCKLSRTFRSPSVQGVEFTDQTVNEYSLDQNYPNPFNPTTNIAYTIKTSGLVRLSVFDVLGREVVVLVNGVQTAGDHQVTFSAWNVTSGIYFYKLQAGNELRIKKMVLVK